jgi:hypothetical protein
MNSLASLIGQFRRGMQQSNRYVCQVLIGPDMVANMIADSLQGNGGIFGTIQRVLSVENSVLSIPQVVKWLAQGYLVNNVRLPDRAFATTDMNQYGYTEHFPYASEYGSLQAHFLMPYALNISNDNAVPRFFSYWQNLIQRGQQGPDSGYDFRFPADYYATVLLTLLDRQNRGTITYKFDNVYPKTVQSAELSWASADWCTFPVEFVYSYWKVLPQAESLALSFVDKLTEGL